MFAVCTATCINCWTDTSPNWCRTKADGKEQKGYHTVLSGIFCAFRQDLFVCHQCALLRVQQVRLFCCFASGLPGPLGMHHSRSTVLAASKAFGGSQWSVPSVPVCLSQQQRSKSLHACYISRSHCCKEAVLFFCIWSTRPFGHTPQLLQSPCCQQSL